MGERRDRHDQGGHEFFHDWQRAIQSESQHVRRTWPIFAWRTEKERERQDEFEGTLDYFDGNEELAKRQLGRHTPEDMLPAEEIASFLAFELAERKVTDWMRLCEECDELQITEAYGMMRTAMYINDEKT